MVTRRLFRARDNLLFAWIMGVGFGALGIVNFVEATDWIERILAVVYIGGVAYGSIRLGRAGVLFTETGLQVRNTLRTHTLKIGQVKRFRLGRWGHAANVALVELVHGGTIPIPTIQAKAIQGRKQMKDVEKTIDELNALLDARRSSPDTQRESHSS